MSIHLYCVLPRAARAVVPPGLNGVDGARVRAVPLDGLVAWVSDIERGTPISIDGVKAHDHVVEAALHTGITPLPARFGQRFDDDAACRAAVGQWSESMAHLLAALAGSIEMTLLVTPSTRRMLRDLQPVQPDSFDQVPATRGRAYLESIRAKDHAAREMHAATAAFADRVSAAVASFVLRSAPHQPVTRLPMLTVSHLVPRVSAEPYRATAVRVPTGGQLRLLVIGPRAPYSFCALRGDGNGAHGMNLAG